MTKALPPFCKRKDLTKDLKEFQRQIRYSDKYSTDSHEYRHVLLPKKYYNLLHEKYKGRLLTDDEWRYIGVCQSVGWEHYLIHAPEPHILLFRRCIHNVENPRKRKSNIDVRRKSDTLQNVHWPLQETSNKRRSLRIATKGE